jgi:hypothetical protein
MDVTQEGVATHIAVATVTSKCQLMVQLALIIDFPHGLTVRCACVVVYVGHITSCEISDVIALF